MSLTLDATPPGYDDYLSTYPTNGVYYVTMGGVVSLDVVLTGTIATHYTTTLNTANYMLIYRSSSGSPTPTIRWQERVEVTSAGDVVFRRGLGDNHETLMLKAAAVLDACNFTANVTQDCLQWVDISNATGEYYGYQTDNSTVNGTSLRFIASNIKGSFVSPSFDVIVTGIVLLLSPPPQQPNHNTPHHKSTNCLNFQCQQRLL